ncbi:MAG: glycogen/starch/alpha-glucan phosphorylase [Desulfobacterales bacterium]
MKTPSSLSSEARAPLPVNTKTALLTEMQRHIMTFLGNDYVPPRTDTYYYGLALSLRDRLIRKWLQTQRSVYEKNAKRIYYLSMEFLPGRFLKNTLLTLDMLDEFRKTIESVGLNMTEIEEQEWDPGLGNGGLGRLASCYMDSMAGLSLPAYGYGIKYDYGIFYQDIVEGYQFERCDNWVRTGTPWEIKRRGYLYMVHFYGRSETYTDADGHIRYRWVDTDNVMAMACDFLVPGYGNEHVTNMRLWAAVSSREFKLEEFNEGDYIGAVESKVMSENISRVLYPRDEKTEGKELRLKQQYFFVAATFQDIIRRFKKTEASFTDFPDNVAVQLNDTHPCISIPEFMRILMDDEKLPWETAWEICTRTFGYTNHTVLPEALEMWSADLLGQLLPRHLEIIYEIDRRFRQEVRQRYPNDPEKADQMAIIQYDALPHKVHMANLAIIGSHKVNGVSMLHTDILKNKLFKALNDFYPDRFINITNGITHRRWLLQSNPLLSELITSTIGNGWIKDLNLLSKLSPMAEDRDFGKAWRRVKTRNKILFASYVLRKTGLTINTETLFDIQAKRIHEYKRQLLNVLHVITMYNRIKTSPEHVDAPPRTVVFAGKAAPGYYLAKLTIKLINSVAAVINNDPLVNTRLQMLFLPNYCVSQAEKLIPAADLSQQISVAGMEASGTGNMKFALNGALTIGTLDGANIEIMEEVGKENIFIFGLKTHEVDKLRADGYDPRSWYDNDPELKSAIDLIGSGHFSPEQPDLFLPIVAELLDQGDRYMVLADYRSYIQTQETVGRIYQDTPEWTRRSILNTAMMGKFSSDRAVQEYASQIWNVSPIAPAERQ